MLLRIAFKISSYRRELQVLLKAREYHRILGLENLNSQDKQIRSNYLMLIKRYHADHCHGDEEKTRQYEEITKIIVEAYKSLQKSKNNRNMRWNSVEDELAYKIYNKPYSQVKYYLHKEGKEAQKQRFYKLLKQQYKYTHSPQTKTNQHPNYSKTEENYARSKSQSVHRNNSSSSINIGSIAMIVVAGILGLSFLNFKKGDNNASNPSTKVKKVSQQQIKDIINNKQQMKQQKRQKLIIELMKDQPPTLDYPKDEDPPLMNQLTHFSIAPDIHLFEVPLQYIQNKMKSEEIRRENLFPLERIKPNTVLTLSLQTQRLMHNIYVRVKDVIAEIEQKGYFQPPLILFRFHGFIMAELREKPLSLKNYRDTEFISLFDMYFDYYSPIFLKKDKFSEYLVEKQNEKLFGWVHLNSRKTIPYFLKKQEKLVCMHYENSKISELYIKIWENYYKLNNDFWKKLINKS